MTWCCHPLLVEGGSARCGGAVDCPQPATLTTVLPHATRTPITGATRVPPRAAAMRQPRRWSSGSRRPRADVPATGLGGGLRQAADGTSRRDPARPAPAGSRMVGQQPRGDAVVQRGDELGRLPALRAVSHHWPLPRTAGRGALASTRSGAPPGRTRAGGYGRPDVGPARLGVAGRRVRTAAGTASIGIRLAWQCPPCSGWGLLRASAGATAGARLMVTTGNVFSSGGTMQVLAE